MSECPFRRGKKIKRFASLLLFILFIGLLASCGSNKNTTAQSADAIINGKPITINEILSAYQKQPSNNGTIKNISVTKKVNYPDYADYTLVEVLQSNAAQDAKYTFHIRIYSNKKTLKFLIETYLHQHSQATKSKTNGQHQGYLFYRNIVYVVSSNPFVYQDMQNNIKELKVLYK